MIDREVLNVIVEEVLIKLEEKLIVEESKKKPKLLVFNNTDKIQIEQLKRYWEVLEVSAQNYVIPEDVDEILFINVNQDLIVKGAIGISDTPDSELLAKSLLLGLPIHFIPSYKFEWILDVNYRKNINMEYVKHILNYTNILESFGVHTISFRNFLKIHSNGENEKSVDINNQITFQGKLLTLKDVENTKDETISVCKSTIVTPLALDVARKLGKSIDVIDIKGVT